MRKVLILAMLLVPSVGLGKTHNYDMGQPCTRVWAAVKDVLIHSGKYGILFMDDKILTASYNIGGYLSGRRTNSAQLTPKGDGCTMSVQTVYSGVFNKDAQDFLARVKESLSKNPQPSEPEPPAAEPGAQKPPAELPEQHPVEATLEISSMPDGADIELDGNFVGNTPSSIGVAPGEHSIKLTRQGFKPWERRLKTTSGNVKISPELEPATQQR